MFASVRRIVFVCFGLCLVASSAVAAEPVKLAGSVLKLSELTERAFTVSTGGLVVVIVRDSGSRPPQDIKVDAPAKYQALGVVRGTQNEQGQPLMGGGYTWYLFTPVETGDGTVKVGYTENGDGGKRVSRTYRVTIEKQP